MIAIPDPVNSYSAVLVDNPSAKKLCRAVGSDVRRRPSAYLWHPFRGVLPAELSVRHLTPEHFQELNHAYLRPLREKTNLLERLFALDDEYCDECLFDTDQELREKRIIPVRQPEKRKKEHNP